MAVTLQDFQARITRNSERRVWVTQILFALVLANGLLINRGIVLHPVTAGSWLALLALGTVFVTALLSWVDFAATMYRNPYTDGGWEEPRFIIDVSIVVAYALMMFSVDDLKHPTCDISVFLWGFVCIFVLYLLSGLLRMYRHGPKASNWSLIGLFTALYVCLVSVYELQQSNGTIEMGRLNIITVSSAFCMMIGYRLIRRRIALGRSKREGLHIGVDVDGVLADQITGVLASASKSVGRPLKYDDIEAWDMPLGEGTDIKAVIEHRLFDKQYVKTMPAHPDAASVMHLLYSQDRITVITSRNAKCRGWTRTWLRLQGIPYDKLQIAGKSGKSGHNLDILIDDYVGHIQQTLAQPVGYAILFDQPWNRNDAWFLGNRGNSRLFVAKSWQDIPGIVEQIRQRRNVEPKPVSP